MRGVLPLLATTLALAPSPQDAPVDPSGRFDLDLPAGWRALTPDEGQELLQRGGVPADLLRPAPPWLLHFGDIDAWLAGRFDGRALTVRELPGEVATDAPGIAELAAQLAARGQPTAAARAVVVGTAGSPAVRVDGDGGGGRNLDLYVPTGGNTLLLQLRWPSGDDQAMERTWTGLCASLTLARPAMGGEREGLGSKLFYAALAGVAVGVLLAMARRARRGATDTPAAPV